MTQEQNQQKQAETREQAETQADKFVSRPGDLEITQPEETTQEQPKVNGNTLRAAKAAVAKKQISADSFRAIEEGELSLQEARAYGRDADRHGNPVGPAPKTVSKKDRSRECACGCANLTRGGVWIPGHDARLPGLVMQALQGEITLTDEQKEHAERRDLFTKAGAKLAAKREKEEAKAAKQAEREAKKQKK